MSHPNPGAVPSPAARPAIFWRRTADLRPYARNARTHSKRQIAQIAESIRRFGFTNPVLVSADGEIIAGHGRVEAAKQLGMTEVPTLALDHLSAAERRAYVLADNKLALNAGWDQEILAIELQGLIDLDFEVELTGFSLAEIDLVLDHAKESNPAANDGDAASDGRDDAVPALLDKAVSYAGDLWQLGRHKLICGDARVPETYARLLGAEQVDLVFTDPPYNVPIDGHVSGLGAVKHREFAFASGEMSEAQFTTFLTESLGAMANRCRDGAIAFVCMDWRHMRELLAAGHVVFSELKNLCVWNKTNGGMGAFYRSKHELVFVWKVGTAPHTNTFGLGETGRYRTNVWDYAGISSISASRQEELEMHPTVKPVALVADAIKDCSRRGEIVLDGFGGSGSTLIAAEKTGRTARLVEYDPGYCDTILRRYQAYTGKQPLLLTSGEAGFEIKDSRPIAFEDVAEVRGVALPDRPPEVALRVRAKPASGARSGRRRVVS
jgi:DNA modification methylase